MDELLAVLGFDLAIILTGAVLTWRGLLTLTVRKPPPPRPAKPKETGDG